MSNKVFIAKVWSFFEHTLYYGYTSIKQSVKAISLKYLHLKWLLKYACTMRIRNYWGWSMSTYWDVECEL